MRLGIVQSLTFHCLCSILIFLVSEESFHLLKVMKPLMAAHALVQLLLSRKWGTLKKVNEVFPEAFTWAVYIFFHRTPPLSAGRAAQAAECFSLCYKHRAWQGVVDALWKHLEAELSSHSPATQQIYLEAAACGQQHSPWFIFFSKRELDTWLHKMVV